MPRLFRRTAAALALAGLLAGCNQTPPPPKPPRAEVVVTSPIFDEVTDYQDFTGRLDALLTVDIRPRVSGYIVKAPFKEGDLVKEGDELFLIDPRSYDADYRQAEGNLKQAEADRKLQDRNYARGRQLFEARSIGQEEFDQITGTWEKSTANATALAAVRDRAKLYLDYTRVTSPISGRISRRNVDPGNLVNAEQTLLTTVVSDDTTYAYFDVDERTYLDLVESSAQRRKTESWFTGLQFPVVMRLANEEDFTLPDNTGFRHVGAVNFVDNRLSGNSGTIRMRGVFPNPDHLLKSGLFVRIRLPIGTPYRAVIVPDEALQSDQGRKYVYVVNDKNVIEYRAVEPGQAVHDLRIIKKGLTGTERVVVEGMQKVREKAEVDVKTRPAPKPPQSTLSKLLSYERSRLTDTAAGGE
jgi:RND family efflux transporter MFP subunit